MPPNATRGPRLYARMLDQAYGALKRVRRSNVVIGGMTWTVGVVSASKFVRWMRLPNGKPPRLDWFGHNPFSVRSPQAEPAALLSHRARHERRRHALSRGRAAPTGAAGRRACGCRSSPSRRRATTAPSPSTSASERRRVGSAAAYKIACGHRYIAGLGWYTLLDEDGPEAGA